MDHSTIAQSIRNFIAQTILDGKDMGLDDETPLLEWGIINSMEIARLVSFIQDQHGVSIPGDRIIPDHFKDIQSLAELVLELGS